MINDELRSGAARVLGLCRAKKLRVATAESCTGGLVGAALTEIPGSSDVFDRGFITYSNGAKQGMLGVSPAILAAHGAVSRETAAAMAQGALTHSDADLVVAITGIAGPDGGTREKPVGLVHLAAAARDGRTLQQELRLGDIGRTPVRLKSVAVALAMLEELARLA
jgi:nicotinamide-nucleotide amidase